MRVLLFVLAMTHGVVAFAAEGAAWLRLAEAAQQSMAHDPVYLGAVAQLKSDRHQLGIARSRLLPTVRANGSFNHNRTDRELPTVNDSLTYKSTTLRVQATHPLLRMADKRRLEREEVVQEGGEHTLASEKSRLMLRVVRGYYSIIDDHLNAERTLLDKNLAAKELMKMREAFSAGFSGKSLVAQQQLKLQQAERDWNQRQNALIISEHAFSELIGRHVTAGDLVFEAADVGEMARVLGTSLEQWREAVFAANPGIKSSMTALVVAQKDIAVQRAGYYPTLDLVASQSYSDSASDNTIGNNYDTASIGVQFSMPIYDGALGYSVDQAVDAHDVAMHQLNAQKNDLSLQVTQAYFTLQAAHDQLTMLAESLDAAQVVLDEAKKRAQKGVGESLEVSRQQANLDRLQLEIAQSEYRGSGAMLELLVLSAEDPSPLALALNVTAPLSAQSN